MRSPIFDIENWKEIGVTLARNKTRTFMTAFGIFWGTAVLAMLWGGAQGLESLMRMKFEGFATNMGIVMPRATTMSYRGFQKGMSWYLTRTDVENIRRSVPHIDNLSALNQSRATVVYSKNSKSVSITGIEPEYSNIFTPIIYDGRFINEVDNAQSQKVCVIGQNLANELFGAENALGKFVEIDRIYYRVVGVAGQKTEIQIGARIDDSVLIPSSTMRRTYNMGEKVGIVMFTTERGYKPGSLKPNIMRILSMRHPISPNDEDALTLMDVSEQFEVVDKMFLGLSLLALFVGAGTLMAGVIGVGNIMWVIVKERTQEIGIRRALGAKPRDIIIQILSESVVLTIVAGLAGICFAVIVLAIAQYVTEATFQLKFIHAIIIMMTFIVLGTLAGLIPAYKAMKIKPIEAINDK